MSRFTYSQLLLLCLSLIALVACGGGQETGSEPTIQIVAPADGAEFSVGQDVLVEVAVQNAVLGQDAHWHLAVDGGEAMMVVGTINTERLRDLAPGEHILTVFLSNMNHEDIADPVSITINVR